MDLFGNEYLISKFSLLGCSIEIHHSFFFLSKNTTFMCMLISLKEEKGKNKQDAWFSVNGNRELSPSLYLQLKSKLISMERKLDEA